MAKTLEPQPPLGTSALTCEVLDAMSQEERRFWDELMPLAGEEIAANQAAGNIRPYTPSIVLEEMLRTAVEQYRGMQYCQMRQLRGMFIF